MKPIQSAGHSGLYLAAIAKALIETAVVMVTSKGKILLAHGIKRIADHDDLAVRLQGHSPARIFMSEEVGDDLAAGTERGIKVAVHFVAGQRKINVRPYRIECLSCRNDPAIGLHGNGESKISAAEKISQDFATNPERRVEVAGGSLGAARGND
jgi:hypothetical protein